ncbi:MAG: hypothetical protein IPH20_15415 [Bacteroidales bacterium]|nr:hypothetical protein [Bacteroidales bacterium]
MSNRKALERFQKIRTEKDIISGIHNYCDRWCERCAFTSRCSVFAMGEEEERIRKQSNEPEKDLAEYVGNMLQDALGLLQDLAMEHGIDLNSIEDEDSDFVKPGKENYLVRKADEHATWLMKWIEKNNGRLNVILQTLEEESMNEYIILNDAIEVLKWYINFIAVKFSRAVTPPYEDSPEGRFDRNGSAKIAIIAVTRSIDALMLLLRFIPDEEDHLLEGLVRLERIKNGHSRFPEAMDFRRPGFDE